MHITYIYSVIIKYGLCTKACLGQARGQQGQHQQALKRPPVRRSPPRTPRSPRRTSAHRRARNLLVHDLHEMMMQCLGI